MRDLASNVGLNQAVEPQVLSATTTSSGIDLAGFNSAMVIIATGAIVGAGDFTPKLQESDVLGSGYTDVAAADLKGTFPTTLAASSVIKVGYIGNKRFVRVVLTKNGGTSIAAGAVIAKGNAATRPAA